MTFDERLLELTYSHEKLLARPNEAIEGNGVYERYKYPVLTAEHAPLFWRYDLDKRTNPYLMERFGIHATLNSGAIKWNGSYVLVVRVEGADRKSFFAVAESPNGVDNFRFWERPAAYDHAGVRDLEFHRRRAGGLCPVCQFPVPAVSAVARA